MSGFQKSNDTIYNLFLFFFEPFVAEAQLVCAERKNQSKRTKICKTNPIKRKLKMLISVTMIITNNYEPRTINYLKRTQTNPNFTRHFFWRACPPQADYPPLRLAGKIAPPALECRYRGSAACGERSRTVEGPVVTNSSQSMSRRIFKLNLNHKKPDRVLWHSDGGFGLLNPVF
jgi:hypothetical protein